MAVGPVMDRPAQQVSQHPESKLTKGQHPLSKIIRGASPRIRLPATRRRYPMPHITPLQERRPPTTLQETFERKYDDLGPEEFSKKVIEFGYWLEAHSRELSPAEREKALAEYSFLQNRLLLWLNYEYKSVREYGYLLSATTKLYQGANNSGLVPFGHLPASMLHVAGTIALFDTPPPRRLRPTTKTPAEELPAELKPPKGVELGAVVDRETAGIVWGKGIKVQGLGEGEIGWEAYNASQNPNAKRLRPGSTGFDLFEEMTGEATSAKTLDTKTMTYIRKPQEIYKKVQLYVDGVVNYEPSKNFDVDPALIARRQFSSQFRNTPPPNSGAIFCEQSSMARTMALKL